MTFWSQPSEVSELILIFVEANGGLFIFFLRGDSGTGGIGIGGFQENCGKIVPIPPPPTRRHVSRPRPQAPENGHQASAGLWLAPLLPGHRVRDRLWGGGRRGTASNHCLFWTHGALAPPCSLGGPNGPDGGAKHLTSVTEKRREPRPRTERTLHGPLPPIVTPH